MRSTREIGVLEIKLQDYEEGNVTDPWDPPPFSTLPPSAPFQLLWDMITKISVEIWEQFVDSDVRSIHCLLNVESHHLLFSPFHISFHTYLYPHQHDYASYGFLVIMLMLLSPHIIMLTLLCHFCLVPQTLPPWLCSLYMQPHFPLYPPFLLYPYQP